MVGDPESVMRMPEAEVDVMLIVGRNEMDIFALVEAIG
jgi:hypothetical protein